MDPELLGCPCCGDKAEYVDCACGDWCVSCIGCRLSTQVEVSKASAAELWNKRIVPRPPKGYKIVPLEPTLKMKNAGATALDVEREKQGHMWLKFPPLEKHAIRYRAMVEAAPGKESK